MTNEISTRNSLLGDLQCSLRVKNLFSILKVTNLLPFVCNKGFDQTDWNAVPFQTVESHPVASSVTNLIVFWVIWLVTDWTGSHTAQRTRKNGNINLFLPLPLCYTSAPIFSENVTTYFRNLFSPKSWNVSVSYNHAVECKRFLVLFWSSAGD